jgi:AraC-like DNA-binding protein
MPDPALMPTVLPAILDAALRGGLIVLLAILAFTLRRDRAGAALTQVAVALAAGLCVQVVSTAPLFESEVPRAWQVPAIAVATANSVLFWLFARALFDDDFVPRPAHAALWAAVASLAAWNCAWLSRAGVDGLAHTLGQWLHGLPLAFALLALAAAARQWRGDLVERRRGLRAVIVVGGSLYTGLMLWARLQSPQGRLSTLAAAVDMLALGSLLSLLAWRLLAVRDSEVWPAACPSPAATPDPQPIRRSVDTAGDGQDPADHRLAEALRAAMQDQRSYRQEDLSIARLAAQLAVPEYRLRRLINQRLGHRNFSAFVNSYRLNEARTVLADPARRHLPVLSIALDAGFQSIGPFNRAFKAGIGMTPTEYRRQKLADS